MRKIYKLFGLKILEVETTEEAPFKKTLKEKVFGTKGAVLDVSQEDLNKEKTK